MTHRQAEYVPGGTYFVCMSGHDHKSVFIDDLDRAALTNLVGHVIGRCGAEVHAFAWLETQLLLVLQVFGVSLSGVVHRVASQHARTVNRRLRRKGCLFQHPHRAVLLRDSGSLLEAIATVHRSPLRMGLSRNAAEFKWSSYRAYLGLAELPLLTKEVALSLLRHGSPGPPIEAGSLMSRSEHRSLLTPVVGGGSDRRPANWSHENFFGWLKARSVESREPVCLDQLIVAVARWFEVDPAAILYRTSSPLLRLARALVVCLAMQNRIASLTELSQRFGRGRSTLHEARNSYRAREPRIFNMTLEEILNGPAIALPEVIKVTPITRQCIGEITDSSGTQDAPRQPHC